MIAQVLIIGEVGVDVKLTDVIAQMKKYPNPTEIEVTINSVGGFVSHGQDIYDYLEDFKIPITTKAEGICASVATKLMLLGTKARQVVKGTPFMIHNPFAATEGDADYLKEFSAQLKKIENEFIAFYSSKLEQPEIAIKPLMKRETFLTEDELLALGFATEIIEGKPEQKKPAELKAVAKLELNHKSNNYMKLDEKSQKTLVEKITNAIKNVFDPKAVLELTDSEGNVLTFSDLEPEQIPSVGDKVDAENGSYTIEGQILIVENGEVIEITEVEDKDDEDKDDEDLEQMKKDFEELQQKYDEQKAALESEQKVTARAKKELEEIRNMVSDFELPKKTPKGKRSVDEGKKGGFGIHKKGSIKAKLNK